MLSKVSKLAIATLTVGGIGGATAFTYRELAKETKIKDVLSGKLLSFDASESQKWVARATKLTKVGNNLSDELKATKENGGDANGSKIMAWCKKNINNKFTSNSDSVFLEVQEYCTYNIKDSASISLETAWSSNDKNNRLLTAATEPTIKLSEAMKDIKAKLEGKEVSKDDNALKDWCTKTYEKPFKNVEDQDYIDVVTYCKVVSD